MAREAGDAPVVPVPMLRGTAHLVLDPELVREVWMSRSFIRPEFFRRAAGEGLLFAEGERWKLSRATLQPWFQPSQVRTLASTIGQYTDVLFESWTTAAQAGEERPIVEELAGLQLRIIGKGVLGMDYDPVDRHIPAIIEYTEAFNALGGAGVFASESGFTPTMAGKLRSGRAALEEMADELITFAKSSLPAEPKTLLHALTSPAFTDPPGGCPVVGHAGLIDELVLLLLASISAATTSMGNAIEFVMGSKAAARGIRAEAARVGDQVCSQPEAHLPYALACFKEGLRLRPPVWYNGRVAIEPCTLSSGHVIEQGDHVHACSYLLHRHPSVWDDPEAFLPERFLGDVRHEGPTYMPFGIGRHFCIGQPITHLIGSVVLSGAVRRFDIEFVSRTSHTPDGGFVLGPALGSTARFVALGG